MAPFNPKKQPCHNKTQINNTKIYKSFPSINSYFSQEVCYVIGRASDMLEQKISTWLTILSHSLPISYWHQKVKHYISITIINHTPYPSRPQFTSCCPISVKFKTFLLWGGEEGEHPRQIETLRTASQTLY